MNAEDAILLNDAGAVCDPVTSGEWDPWVSGGRLRNVCLQDPLLDWLDRHGGARGFVRDDELPGYDERTDFLKFIGRKGEEFERCVIDLLRRDHHVQEISTGGWEEVRSLERARQTVAAMAEGVPIITQAVVRNPERRTYGAIDLLVRADVLDGLFPGVVPADERWRGSPRLGVSWHYRVIDIKYTGLDIGKTGHANAAHLPHMTQVALYNEAIGRVQGYQAPSAYVLGRTLSGAVPRPGCMSHLARVDMDYAPRRGPSLTEVLSGGIAWIRRVRTDGHAWDVLPTPSIAELRPNMKNHKDQPWHAARTQIAEAQQEFTQLWNVGLRHREQALAAGIPGWRDRRTTATALGVTGESRVSKLDALLAANLDPDAPAIAPARIAAGRDVWLAEPPLEFFVDFETTSSLDDDFALLPDMNGNPSIFMIGCGHVEAGEWRFECFIADDLGLEAERRAIDAWFAHMTAVTDRLAPGSSPRVFHWSGAETQAFDSAFNAARKRHPDASWPDPNWYDLLKNVVKAEPVTVRGGMGFGLKAVARACHALGIIETKWADGPADGLGAMTGAWWCNQEARRLGLSMATLDLMGEIATYNEVDCRVMQEILCYLRRHH